VNEQPPLGVTDATVPSPPGAPRASTRSFRVLKARLSGVGIRPEDDDDLRAKKTLLVLLAVLILPVSLIWGSLYLGFGAAVGYIPFIYFVVSIASLVVFAQTGSFRLLLNTQLLDVMLTTTMGQMLIGGFLPSGGVALWGGLAPLAALLFVEVREAVRWFVAFVLIFVITGVLGGALFPDADLPLWFTTTMLALNIVGTGAIAFTLLASFAKERNEALTALRAEQARSESLLVSILPRPIAERLKAANGRIADHLDSASIVFADLVNFTPLSERLPAAEVVGMLDELFSHFDGLVERHGLEKIKTIGDCYMAAAGVPDPYPDHARRAALLAIDMRDAVGSWTLPDRSSLQLRIGINSGPVVAGVIGTKRFLYDLYGDAVNTASRMETHSVPGEIQITSATHELLKDDFECTPRGSIEVKGKGWMETWYLVGCRSDLRAPDEGCP
jgi:adenylate cyclase